MNSKEKWNKDRLGNYMNYYEKYYYGTLLFNKVIVQKLESQFKTSENNYNLLLEEVEKNKNLEFFKRILFINNLSLYKKNPSIILDISNRFENLTKAFVNVSKLYNIKVIDCTHRYKLLRRAYLLKYGLFSKQISKLIRDYMYTDLEDLLENDKKMNELNNLVKKQVYDTAEKMKKDNIKLIILTDELSTRKLLLVEAAKIAKIPCYSIPHGYPQTKFYHPLVCSDQLLVWNREQKERLSKDVNESRISIFGYPRYDERYIDNIRKSIEEDRYLITYVTHPPQTKTDRDFIYKGLRRLQRAGFRINIRLHPLELTQRDDTDERIRHLTSYGFTLSTELLLTDIFKSRLILGEMSSVLYEALLIKNNSIQVYDERKRQTPFYSQISSIKVDDLYKLADTEYINELLKQNKMETLVCDFEIKAESFLKEALNLN